MTIPMILSASFSYHSLHFTWSSQKILHINSYMSSGWLFGRKSDWNNYRIGKVTEIIWRAYFSTVVGVVMDDLIGMVILCFSILYVMVSLDTVDEFQLAMTLTLTVLFLFPYYHLKSCPLIINCAQSNDFFVLSWNALMNSSEVQMQQW